MKLRAKQRLLNLLSLTLLVGGAAILALAWQAKPPRVAAEPATDRSMAKLAKHDAGSTVAVQLNAANWNRTLRQPLYDPPPPPPPEVVIEQRPITVKLVGTAVEAENSQAFIRQASGAVEIKRLGDGVTADAADGVIAGITPVEIVIKREDGEHRLGVEGRN